jgi:hypothetical protein
MIPPTVFATAVSGTASVRDESSAAATRVFLFLNIDIMDMTVLLF